VAAILFGTTGTARALGPDVSPLGVGASRIAVGAALLAIVAAALARRNARPDATRAADPGDTTLPADPGETTRPASAPAPASLRAPAPVPHPWSAKAVLIGGAGVGGYQLAFFAAVADTGVAVGTVVALGSAPVFTGILSRVTQGVRLDARWAACTALATAGVAVLVTSSGSNATVSPLGVALALGAGAGYATYTVAAKRLLDHGHAPEAVMARTFGTGALILLPVIPATGFSALATAPAITEALYLGAIPTALAYVLFARGLRHLPTAEVATLTLAEPLTAAALGTIVLGEQLAATAALGAAMVLGGLAALAVKPRRPRRTRPPVVQDAAT
jgi:DME family drug/metabolite transporter